MEIEYNPMDCYSRVLAIELVNNSASVECNLLNPCLGAVVVCLALIAGVGVISETRGSFTFET